MAESPENVLKHLDGAPFFSEPLVGVAAGDDPLFTEYKQVIGAFHQTPQEIASSAWGAEDAWRIRFRK